MEIRRQIRLFELSAGNARTRPGFALLATPRDTRFPEFEIIKQYFASNDVDESALYGFLSNKFLDESKTSKDSLESVTRLVPVGTNLISLTGQSNRFCLFASTLEEIEFSTPGFAAYAQSVWPAPVSRQFPCLVMDLRQSVLGTNFLASPSFWREWIRLHRLLQETLHPFLSLLLERLPSVMLATQPEWLAAAPVSFRLPEGAPVGPKAPGTVDAAAIDALKLAYNETGIPEYLATFLAARRNFLLAGRGPFDEEILQLASSPPSLLSRRIPTGQTPKQTAESLPVLASLDISSLIARASELQAQTGPAEAIRLYKNWLVENPSSSTAFIPRFNLGHLLSETGDLAGAEREYLAALQQHPGFPQARLNLGSVIERQGDRLRAIGIWQDALSRFDAIPSPDPELLVHVLNNLGRTLELEHRYAEAEAMLTRSLSLRPDQKQVIHHWVHLRQKECHWPVYSPLPGIEVGTMVAATSALATLSASDDPALQFDIATRWARENIPTNLPPMAPPDGYRHDKLRIGYLSSNFGMHAVSILTAELYELHDRNAFEVWGFCWSPEDNSPMRARVIAAMDHFVKIGGTSDLDAAQLIRNAEIDILVDLQGLTSGCRPVILAHRPAPVQVTYLGFPGTTGLPGIDYVLCDRYIVPDEALPWFSEKPLYLPACFQVNDRKRAAGPRPKRSDYGLRDSDFVYCVFNHNHKFTPELFQVWLNILRRTENSVLWLLADNDQAKINLTEEVARSGLDPSRVIFAPRVLPLEYLARFQIADLFLDTLPFNGGTTASDALWMGLPVLTCSGRSFASRMAGSLLSAIGAPELITHTLDEYENLAVSLAADRPRMLGLRQRVEANRLTHPLFDTPLIVRHIEAAYRSVVVQQRLAA